MKISKPLHKTYTVKMQQKCAYYTLDYKCAGLKELKKRLEWDIDLYGVVSCSILNIKYNY